MEEFFVSKVYPGLTVKYDKIWNILAISKNDMLRRMLKGMGRVEVASSIEDAVGRGLLYSLVIFHDSHELTDKSLFTLCSLTVPGGRVIIRTGSGGPRWYRGRETDVVICDDHLDFVQEMFDREAFVADNPNCLL